MTDLTALFDQYIHLAHHFGRNHYRHIPYAFSWGGQSGENLHTPAATLTAENSDLAPVNLGLSTGTAPPHLPLLRARSLQEYEATTSAIEHILTERQQYEADLIPRFGETVFQTVGECVVCRTRKMFQTSFMYASGTLPDGRQIPNWREHLKCLDCGFVNRLRATMHIIFQELKPHREAKIYLTEQVTPMYSWLKSQFPNLVGSEYMGPDKRPGQQVGDIRHEDIQNLSFQSESFDIILSFDVLEHVPDEKRALAEFARCLRPGGTLLFTAPFDDDRHDHKVRALLQDDGTIQHLMPPEYHGNPVDAENGALCFRYYGWELMDDLRAVGFSDPEGWFYWSSQYGYLGDTSNIFFARRR